MSAPIFPGRVFDYPDPVPADLAGRWTAAGPDRLVLLDLALLWSTAGAVIGAMLGVAGLVVGAVWPAVALVAVAVLIGVASILLRRALTRRRVLLPTKQIDLVVAHRREVSLSDSGDRESALARRAFACATAIKATAAWRCGETDGHRILLDPDDQAREIYVACAEQQRLGRLLPELEGPTTSVDLSLLIDSREQNIAALGRRVEEFEHYLAELSGLSTALENRDRAARIRHLADLHIPALVASTAHQEWAGDRLHQLADDAAGSAETT